MSGRSDKSLESDIALPKHSKSVPENDGANARLDAHPDIIENILLDIEPVGILKPSGELDSRDLHEDFEDKGYTCIHVYSE